MRREARADSVGVILYCTCMQHGLFVPPRATHITAHRVPEYSLYRSTLPHDGAEWSYLLIPLSFRRDIPSGTSDDADSDGLLHAHQIVDRTGVSILHPSSVNKSSVSALLIPRPHIMVRISIPTLPVLPPLPPSALTQLPAKAAASHLASFLEKGKGKTVMLSGAGLSVDSGIRAYRGEDGTYSNPNYKCVRRRGGSGRWLRIGRLCIRSWWKIRRAGRCSGTSAACRLGTMLMCRKRCKSA